MPRLSLSQPPTAQFFCRNTGQVGLDIENWSAIEHIDPTNMQVNPFPAKQLNGGKANRIRTSRRPRGKYTMLPVVGGRRRQQVVPS